ncbi:MAG: DUF485 domain-containing protein [Planctomycetales bacterium]|nr:DUF485 domain-containing protein [Planctomycetales bacterium]
MHDRNARIGAVLCLIYSAVYSGFVLLNVFKSDIMETTPLPGINLAILYGFGLIVLAFLLALLYGVLCRNDVKPDTSRSQDRVEGQS